MITLHYHDKGQGPLYPKWPALLEEVCSKQKEAEVQVRPAEDGETDAGQNNIEADGDITPTDPRHDPNAHTELALDIEESEKSTATELHSEQEHSEDTIVVARARVGLRGTTPRGAFRVVEKPSSELRRHQSPRMLDSEPTYAMATEFFSGGNAGFQAMAMQITMGDRIASMLMNRVDVQDRPSSHGP